MDGVLVSLLPAAAVSLPVLILHFFLYLSVGQSMNGTISMNVFLVSCDGLACCGIGRLVAWK